MEEEAEKLKEMQGEVEKQMMSTKTSMFLFVMYTGCGLCAILISLVYNTDNFPTPEEKQEADARSVYVGSVSMRTM